MAETVEWRDPKPTSGASKGSTWPALLEPLMEHPKRWAMVRRCDKASAARNLASNLTRGALRSPPGQWEFTSRSQADGSGEVFARYLGADNGVGHDNGTRVPGQRSTEGSDG